LKAESNCKGLAGLLMEKGLDAVDLTVPGWKPTTSNNKKLMDNITGLNPESHSIFVCELVSNMSF